MKEIINILNSDCRIIKVIVQNFTVLNEELTIMIDLFSDKFGHQTIIFEEVSNLNIDSRYYGVSEKSLITAEDLSEYQLENINYKVAISEDAMTFNCARIRL